MVVPTAEFYFEGVRNNQLCYNIDGDCALPATSILVVLLGCGLLDTFYYSCYQCQVGAGDLEGQLDKNY
ncbi:MAG: hypothetical protein EZS28_004944 [Streblomastix strix]|uniref:Uncharacterized protein n=1 Tax=Streblomastix strix TaxID=222440 RepID=A0A5J4WZA4_9EUKA|nr:MAG: hypothetical protein EZS28_004944 [Streblomastix strix]